MSNDFDSPDLKLYIGQLRGYRYWWAHRGTLFSISMGTIWREGVLQARCNNHTEEGVPKQKCQCGIYGWYTPEEALRNHAAEKFGLSKNEGLILGAVSAQGKIVPGTVGFKAEKVKVEAIATDNVHPYDCEQCALTEFKGFPDFSTRYPDIETFDTHEALIAKYPPQPLPEGLMAKRDSRESS